MKWVCSFFSRVRCPLANRKNVILTLKKCYFDLWKTLFNNGIRLHFQTFVQNVYLRYLESMFLRKTNVKNERFANLQWTFFPGLNNVFLLCGNVTYTYAPEVRRCLCFESSPLCAGSLLMTSVFLWLGSVRVVMHLIRSIGYHELDHSLCLNCVVLPVLQVGK